jgi:excisionase family DNA binding protein
MNTAIQKRDVRGTRHPTCEREDDFRHLTPTLSPIEAERVCVTRFELAELLRVSVRTVDRMIAAEEIRVCRVRGKAVRFLRSDVEQYLNGGAVAAPRAYRGASRTGK